MYSLSERMHYSFSYFSSSSSPLSTKVHTGDMSLMKSKEQRKIEQLNIFIFLVEKDLHHRSCSFPFLFYTLEEDFVCLFVFYIFFSLVCLDVS